MAEYKLQILKSSYIFVVCVYVKTLGSVGTKNKSRNSYVGCVFSKCGYRNSDPCYILKALFF